jgi:hypothetical protein
MPLSAETLEALEAAKAAIEKWRTDQLAEIERQAALLRSMPKPAEDVTADALQEAVDSAQTFTEGL